MKKYFNKTLLITSLTCLFPILVGILLYDKLPSEVPIHFDFEGKPDNYASKNIAVFLMPLILIFINTLCNVAIDSDPKKQNTPTIIKNISKWIVPVVAVFIVPSTLLIAIGIKIKIVFVVALFISLLFIVIGNYLPKCKQNYTVGIKVPWTLNSEDNWNKTHRFSGFLFFFSGVFILISSFFNYFNIILIAIVIIAIVPILYSFILYKKGI